MSTPKVESENTPAYVLPKYGTSDDDDEHIAESLRRLSMRLRTPGLAFSSPSDVKDYLVLTLAERQREYFCAIFLDSQHCLIEFEELFAGTVGQTSVYPREVVKRALALNAGAVVLAHNHPSGSAEPSRADEFLTQTLKQALALVDVRVLDHVIVGGTKTVSFAERGLL